jgi:glyoxylate/hydroxypyruvate reductase A
LTLIVQFQGRAALWPEWQPSLLRAFAQAGIDAALEFDADPATVDVILYSPTEREIVDFGIYPRCRLVQSLWAGVERIAPNPTLTQPLCRMVDAGLTQGMVEYVCGHVLRYHLGIDAVRAATSWDPVIPPLASHRPVAMLGVGALGAACAQALAGLGFDVMGWSRRPKTVDGITCYHGADGLVQVLSRAQIVVTLLPATAETENLLNAETLALLPRGAAIINPGRGRLIDDDALLAALGSGQVGDATLDVFRVEPLPQAHPYWSHPRVTVTPHIAAETRPETSALLVAENIRRLLDGRPLLHQVDRQAGY